MNQSHFIHTMKKEYSVDFNEIWKNTIGHKSDYDQERALNDSTEAEFWKEYSLKYDSVPSLMDYAPEVLDVLVEVVGQEKNLVEFGCGTGKFTLPMSKLNKSVIGVDFSKDMLQQLERKINAQNISNIELKHGKLESIELPKVDAVYGINANYRMLNIKEAINKMCAVAHEKVVIVWTMQRSPYDAILNETEMKGIGRGQEYIQLLNVLYEMGIDPSMKMLDVIKPIPFQNASEHYEPLEQIAIEHGLDKQILIDGFNKRVTENANEKIYHCPLKVAVIHFNC